MSTADTRSTAVFLLADPGVTYAPVVDSDRELRAGLAAGGRAVDRQIAEMPAARLEKLVVGPAASAPTP